MRTKKGVHKFPNKRAMLSILPRVSSNMDLNGFYAGIATKLAGVPVTLDAFMRHWQEQADQYLEGELHDFVMNNAPQYIKALVWHHNPMFAATLISRYENMRNGVEEVHQRPPTVPPPLEPQPVSAPEPVPVVTPVSGIVVGADDSVGSVEVDEDATATVVITTAEQPSTPMTITVGADGVEESDDFSVESPVVEDAYDESIFGDVEADSEAISQEVYSDLVTEVNGMTVSELEAFAEMYDIDISGQRLKADIRDAILSELSDRVE